MATKSRIPAQKAKVIADAWEELAPDATFAGMSLAQFRNKTKASQDARDERSSLRARQRGKREEVASADSVTRKANKQVVAAVVADATHGSDSALYAAMDYVTDSQRQTPKRKSNGNGNGQPHPS